VSSSIRRTAVAAQLATSTVRGEYDDGPRVQDFSARSRNATARANLDEGDAQQGMTPASGPIGARSRRPSQPKDRGYDAPRYARSATRQRLRLVDGRSTSVRPLDYLSATRSASCG